MDSSSHVVGSGLLFSRLPVGNLIFFAVISIEFKSSPKAVHPLERISPAEPTIKSPEGVFPGRAPNLFPSRGGRGEIRCCALPAPFNELSD